VCVCVVCVCVVVCGTLGVARLVCLVLIDVSCAHFGIVHRCVLVCSPFRLYFDPLGTYGFFLGTSAPLRVCILRTGKDRIGHHATIFVGMEFKRADKKGLWKRRESE